MMKIKLYYMDIIWILNMHIISCTGIINFYTRGKGDETSRNSDSF